MMDLAPRTLPADSPPRFADPRRFGTLIGLVGACVFVFGYTPGFSDPLAVGVRILVLVAVAATLWFLFVSPRPLGPLVPAGPWQMGVYVLCVVAEFAVIAAGTRLIDDAGAGHLRPALITLVVGVHFLPFAWAFSERMFYTLGGTLVVLGGIGLVIGTTTGALLSAVLAGWAMSCLLLAYSLGFFRRGRRVDAGQPAHELRES
ncbi:hypothetical protein [Arthrobacter sp. B0490]|uniref:hypothetical protein n=1 Tax=Arthrobacter sp. B0490 TaxID=2058891 RepID=UPI000CE3C543|nr:hypothetical protein [Arthrobacter sp. B0490]